VCYTGVESSILRVPIEAAVSSFRASHKDVENQAIAIAKYVTTGKIQGSPQECRSKVEKLITKVQTLRSKVAEAGAKERALLQRCRNRYAALSKEPPAVSEDAVGRGDEFVEPTEKIDRAVVDYLLREGCMETARQYASPAVAEMFEFEVFQEAHNIQASLRSKETDSALAWCAKHRHRLKKLHSSLEVDIHLQRFVTMVEQGEVAAAVTYVREHLGEGALDDLPQVKRALTMMVLFGADLRSQQLQSELASFRSEDRWKKLAAEFRAAFLEAYGMPQSSGLEMLLQAGFFALRTPACEEARSVNCPTCMPEWQSFIQKIPKPHRVRSILICPISGKPMGSDNPPMASPDGHVYALHSLQKLAETSADGSVLCPATQKQYPLSSFQRVYVT